MIAELVHTEKLLLSGVAAGDEHAFGKLFHLYEARLYTVLMRLTRNQPATEEILQDVFLKVWLKREQLPAIDNFDAWLYTIAENRCYNYLKSLQREKGNKQRFAADKSQAVQSTLPAEFADKEYQLLLTKAVGRLPPKQKQAYQLVKQNGLTREQAARQLQVNPETIKSNLDNAMRSIRQFCIHHLRDIVPIIACCLFLKNK